MNDFIEKLEKMQEIRDSLEDHIWDIFSKYIRRDGIYIDSDDTWEYDRGDMHITFRGNTGNCGYYKPLTFAIPLKFFVNPKKAFKELEEEKEIKKKAENAALKRKVYQHELAELERLKKKYEA